ncbi:hypothetical protein [Metabacillus arenae]|uniref:Uncharacterized protein n=1 Tax=Metabacillus arenae TaxID=2771434 RepID=A0A926RWH5_9BACI|nr:hypothetical protein [Metabacillus arenae]MBD1379172.1 hypothetical protein [Metabacillus arenae]
MLNMTIENLQVEKVFNSTLDENVFRLIATIDGSKRIVGDYETIKEANTAKRTIERLYELQTVANLFK